RVMTIHQAKGLGFDVVFFPQPFNARARPMGQRDPSKPLVSYDPLTRRPRWILNPPPRALMKADEILATELRREAADLAFDELCVLYVAMTRAKRALYVITDAPRKKKTDAPRKKKEDFLAGFSSSVFLRERFAAAGVGDGRITVGGEECLCLYERGNPKWFWTLAAGSEVRGDPGKGPNLSEFGKRKSHRVRLALVRPSDEEQAVRNAAWCFAEENPKVLAFGSEIHALFRRVEWIETLEVQQVIADWLKECKTNDAEVQRDVCEQFCRAVEVPEVRGALAKPVATAELWREQAFEIILDDRLVSGVFDRVTIQRDNGGTVAFVEVLDYKSDRVEKEEDLPRLVEQYRPQLELYARALCRIFHLPSERVGKTILFTRPARVIKL
ncbi:MAG: hypothetical protein N2255_10750, partial [Kiritimatiellae bacterium]|nr:hypothetical protein [Kiritimatiellia bacterium]